MIIAKIIRHRHKHHHYINDDLKEVKEVVHYKITFSDPAEMELFKIWCVKNKGIYDYDKNHSCQNGKLPKIKAFKDEICWCDIMAYYLIHIAHYKFMSTIHPYKGEVYYKNLGHTKI